MTLRTLVRTDIFLGKPRDAQLSQKYIGCTQARSAIGYSAEVLAQLTCEDITHPDVLDLEASLMRECVAGDRPHYQLEIRYIHKGKHEIWVNLTVAVLKDKIF